MTLWNKGEQTHERVLAFTAGKDRQLDNKLIKADIVGTLAHVSMLNSIGLLSNDELGKLQKELNILLQLAIEGDLTVPLFCEDVHSFIEEELTSKLGDTGKKVHTGRSRNDQVLLDIRLYLKDEIRAIVAEVESLFRILMAKSREHSQALMPGYTHMQVAMPSSFGLWFSAFAEGLTDDLRLMSAAHQIVNRNPLGSGAGYGSSLPLDREFTTQMLEMDGMNVNSVYAHQCRGKVERTVVVAMAAIASTLGKLAYDTCLYMGQNYQFISFPNDLTTGSSIMPHKRNPDVWELIRAQCNRIQALPNEITLVTSNLPTGYHRDFQIIKESLFPAIESLKECLRMATFMLEHIRVNSDILNDEIYQHIFSVEEANRLVLEGIPFRDAYRQVAESIKNGTLTANPNLNHTHIGSIGNLSLELIEREMERVFGGFS
jgi:argininosuccinate lyase